MQQIRGKSESRSSRPNGRWNVCARNVADVAQAAGECYRLYTENAYTKRAQVAEAEILRTDLSSAILTLIAMKQNPFDFPYIDEPSRPFSKSTVSLPS